MFTAPPVSGAACAVYQRKKPYKSSSTATGAPAARALTSCKLVTPSYTW